MGEPQLLADVVAGRLLHRGNGQRLRVYLQVFGLADLDHLDLIAAEVAPQLD
jgi:hypothetical protein